MVINFGVDISVKIKTMIEDDFYATLKLKTGEEVFALVIASEEENRTIEILLSEPLSRTSLFFQKYAVFILNMFIMASIICLSIYIPSLIINMELGIYGIFSATFSVTLIAILIGTCSFSISAITGKRRLSLIIPIIVSLLSYISNIKQTNCYYSNKTYN